MPTRNETRPGMNKFLFTRESHLRMKRVEFQPAIEYENI